MSKIHVPDEREVVDVYLQELDPNYPAQLRASMNSRAVDEYADAMGRGDEFPMPVLVNGPRGCIPVDGHHRIEAMRKLGHDRFAAQVIPTPEGVDATEFARLLAIRFNNRHGIRKTRQDRRNEALSTIPLMHKLGMSNREMARELSVDEKTIRTLKRELGITLPSTLDEHLACAVMHDFHVQNESEVEAIANETAPPHLDESVPLKNFPIIPRNVCKELQHCVRQNKERLGISEPDAINLLMATASLLARMTPSDACLATNALYVLHAGATA